jgi:hypothetical protein
MGGMIAVESSDLSSVDFDWSGTLTIEFHSGGVYEYYGVPASEYHDLLNASSHGKYFHAQIKDRYACRQIAR